MAVAAMRPKSKNHIVVFVKELRMLFDSAGAKANIRL
jgi:hypothetical protein